MTILEIIAEQRLGMEVVAGHPHLRSALERLDSSARRGNPSEGDRARIASLVELCLAYHREKDPDERANILRTLEEVSADERPEAPTATMEEWEAQLAREDPAFRKAKRRLDQRRREFRAKYFSFRANAGLRTQEAVAKRSGLRRSYIATIEAGLHFPQQKTLQKLAKAFNVDVAELLV